MSDASPTVLFEHPLNEKMRTWLRIEFLLQQLHDLFVKTLKLFSQPAVDAFKPTAH